MRRFQTLLFAAGLAAAPTSALAEPTDSRDEDRSVEVFEWSMGKGRLGLMLMGLTPELRTHFGATSTTGVLIARVEADSPAAKAGVRVGDVLTKANDQTVDEARDVRAAIANAKKGDTVDLVVVRDRKPLTFKVVLTNDAAPASFESFWSKDWLRDFMRSFEELKKPKPAPTTT
jgi:membrane-associated protease RseP (regulator of RpoE activity)